MKKIIRTLILATFISVPLFILAQSPPHPNGGSGPTGDNTPVGGGLITMLVLGVVYGTKKVYDLRRKVNE